MAEFRAANQELLEYYEGEFDRILEFGGGADLPAIQEAAVARINYCRTNGDTVAEQDEYLASLGRDLPEMAMNTLHLESILNLLEHYIEIGFDHGSTADPVLIAAYRERAKLAVADLRLAAEVFDIVQQTDMDFPFGGEAAA